jgi:hypothetical protein
MAVQPAVPFADIENQIRPFQDLENGLLRTHREKERARRQREQAQRASAQLQPGPAPGGFKKIKTWLCGDKQADEDDEDDEDGCFKKAGNLLSRTGQQRGTVGDDDDEDDDGGECFTEIRNLLYIESSQVHKKALEEWQRKEKLFTSRVERKTKKVGNLKNEVYQMLGFFSVFQGVVLTAVAQSNLLHCNNKWSPIVLSVLASVLTIAAVTQKLSQVSSLQKTINSEERSLKIAVRRGAALRSRGEEFVFGDKANSKWDEPPKEHFWWYTAIVLSFLFLFTVAFPVSHWRILCYPGPNPYSP